MDLFRQIFGKDGSWTVGKLTKKKYEEFVERMKK